MPAPAQYTYSATGELLRTCATCKQPKPIDQFDESRFSKDRLAASCKTCVPGKQPANKQSEPRARGRPVGSKDAPHVQRKRQRTNISTSKRVLNEGVRKINGTALTRPEWAMLRLFAANKCLCCRELQEPNDLVPAYIIPMAEGGASGVKNRQPLCEECADANARNDTDFRSRRYIERVTEIIRIRDAARRERYKTGVTKHDDGNDRRTKEHRGTGSGHQWGPTHARRRTE